MFKYFAVSFIAIVAFCLEGHVFAVKVVFDNAHDISKVADMTCEYSDDYNDFWVYGCERNVAEDVYPEREGFWTACNRHCALIYHGGSLPKPAKLWIETYIQGDNYIDMSGKNKPTDPNFDYNFGRIDSSDGDAKWFSKEIDLADFPEANNASVIKFNISSSTEGFVLIDKIIVDLGDISIEPINLESKTDELPMHWSFDDCHHLEDYADFWTFGCPVDPVEDNPNNAVGFWSSCSVASCKIEFATSPSIIPSSVRVRGYVEDAAQIKIVLPCNDRLTVVETISANAVGGWVDFVFDLSSYHQYKIGVMLESNGGTAVLDSLSFSFDGEASTNTVPTCPSPTTTTTTTTPTPSTTEVTGSTDIVTGSTTQNTGSTATATVTTPENTASTTTTTGNPTTTTPTTTPPTSTEAAGGTSAPVFSLAAAFPLLAWIVVALR